MKNLLKSIDHESSCTCSHDGMFVPTRLMCVGIVLCLLVMLLAGVGGYFMGKKHVMDDFIAKIEQDSFADQIYSSLCLLGDQDPDELRAEASEQEAAEAQAVDAATASVSAPSVSVEPVVSAQNAEAVPAGASIVKEPKERYYAQLIGFGSHTGAQEFVRRMEKKSIEVAIKRRETNSARGKKRVWYQVITPEYTDKNLLAKLIDRISKEEKLVGVQIVTA